MENSFAARHKGLWEFIKFALVGLLTNVVEIIAFSLLNLLIFSSLSGIEFKWWLFDYGVENGGLCSFLSFAVSFALSQSFNFIMQRKVTFGATNNKVVSAILYGVMVVGIYLLVLWLPTLFISYLYDALGKFWGGLCSFLICMNASFWIQYPINKFVIMRKKA